MDKFSKYEVFARIEVPAMTEINSSCIEDALDVAKKLGREYFRTNWGNAKIKIISAVRSKNLIQTGEMKIEDCVCGKEKTLEEVI